MGSENPLIISGYITLQLRRAETPFEDAQIWVTSDIGGSNKAAMNIEKIAAILPHQCDLNAASHAFSTLLLPGNNVSLRRCCLYHVVQRMFAVVPTLSVNVISLRPCPSWIVFCCFHCSTDIYTHRQFASTNSKSRDALLAHHHRKCSTLLLRRHASSHATCCSRPFQCLRLRGHTTIKLPSILQEVSSTLQRRESSHWRRQASSLLHRVQGERQRREQHVRQR